jgi:hypothetical protein
MCCHCDQIVPAYLAERNNDFPDIVYFNRGPVLQLSHAVFIAWLIRMMDSSRALGYNPEPEDLHRGVKDSVLHIVSMVAQCEDPDEFFDNLIEWGCVTKYTAEKEKEEQELPTWRFQEAQRIRIQHFYRVHGHMKNEWIQEPCKARLFRDFQTLTLLEAGKHAAPPVYRTHLDFRPAQRSHHPDNLYTLLSQLKVMALSS